MSNWTEFTEAIPWFLDEDAVVKVGKQRPPRTLSPQATKLFPRLAELLTMGSFTDVSVDGVSYELVAWNPSDGGRLGWMCLPPPETVPADLHEDHRILLASFGGIIERLNEPEDTWLLNLDDALTQREATHDANFIQRNYGWSFENAGLTLPVEPRDYYSISREANGDGTFCHRENGEVLMFAPDHCFDHLSVLEGCPEYTLYRIGGVNTFREWVNAVAAQWLGHVGPSQG